MRIKTITTTIKLLLIGFVVLFWGSFAYAQNLLTGSNMESATGWTIDNQGSVNPAAYQFNYTTSKPINGSGGCLRVTASSTANILFYQKVTLTAGKKYIVDAAVKTNNVASFWCEFFMSTTAPVAGQDYNPSGGLIRGLSTWVGCGPNLDGLMSIISCNGSTSFIPAGTAGTSVSVYFGIKTGSMANPFPNAMEVLIDQVSVKEVNDAILISTANGVLDQTNKKITSLPPTLKASRFREGLDAWASSTINIIDQATSQILRFTYLDSIYVSSNLLVKVTGVAGTTNYTLEMRSLSSENNITATTLGTLDVANNKITGIPNNVRVAQLLSALSLSQNCMAKVQLSGADVSGEIVISPGMTILVTSENGTTKTYTLTTGAAMAVTIASGITNTVSAINNTIYEVSGNSVIHIINANNPLVGSMVNLTSQNVWLYFDNIKPQEVFDKYLKQILISGSVSVVDANMRLAQYLNGTIVISHPSTYIPLTLYSGTNLTGSQKTIGINSYNKAAELGTMNDNIVSFTLKKGYMATFAADEVGTGFSRVYVADNADITINQLPAGLSGKVSFVRVVPWHWVTKKGWCGGSNTASDILNCTWRYDWDNVATSTNNIEYIPMRHGRWWNAYSNIDNKINSTHALGFNEPDRPDQANMPVSEAITLWPNLLTSGLRLGSPCPSDGGINWLFDFIKKCDSLNYRVDFVAMHFYMGGQTARQFYDRLKWIHDVTKRPIWITEWNNGANWTCCKPTYESQANIIGQFMNMLDTTSFVERYSIYEWVEDTRQMFYSGSTTLTPAGKVYRDKISPLAYNATNAYYPALFDLTAPSAPVLSSNSVTSTGCGLSWVASTDNGLVTTYQVFQNGALIGTTALTNYAVSTLSANTLYSFTVKAVDQSGNVSVASNVVSVTTAALTGETPVTGKIYRIIAKHSGKSLTIRGASTANSAYLTQNTYNAATHQQFKLVANGSYFNIYPQQASGKVLDVSGSSTADGAQVLQYTYGSTKTNQQWSFVSVGSGYYQIKCRNSSKCMYVENSNTADDILVKQQTCNTSSANQLFTFTTSLLKSKSSEIEEPIAVDNNIDAMFYPNPFSHSITMKINNGEINLVKVVNSQGVVVELYSKNEIFGNTIRLGDKLSKGVYFVVITDNIDIKTYKIVKQ
jgi:hypothetical protein